MHDQLLQHFFLKLEHHGSCRTHLHSIRLAKLDEDVTVTIIHQQPPMLKLADNMTIMKCVNLN